MAAVGGSALVNSEEDERNEGVIVAVGGGVVAPAAAAGQGEAVDSTDASTPSGASAVAGTAPGGCWAWPAVEQHGRSCH